VAPIRQAIGMVASQEPAQADAERRNISRGAV